MELAIDPKAAGLDPARLARVDDHLCRRYLDPGKLAGCQVLVARGDHVGHLRSLGLADRERDRPVREDTIWRIYSMTKPVTAVALLLLHERGQLQLTDPVHRYLPQWRQLKVAERDDGGGWRFVDPARPMTVRDLLMHTSGLGYEARGPRELGGDPDAPANQPGGTLEDLVNWLADRPLHFHPGTRWRYSVATDVCGYLVELISGRSFDEFLRTEVFEPLGMVDTGFHVPDEKLDRFAASYRRNRHKELVLLDDPQASTYREPPSLRSGGSGLVSTVGDYLRFCRMLARGGELDGLRLLGRRTVGLMTADHLPGDVDMAEVATGGFGEVGFAGMGFGLTVAVALGPTRTQSVVPAGTYTWGGFASTLFWIDPVEDLVAIFMTQFVPSGTFDFRGQLQALVYAALAD